MEHFLYRMKADKENVSKKGWAYDEQRLFDGIGQRKTSGAYIVKKITPMLKHRSKGSDDNDFRNEVPSVS